MKEHTARWWKPADDRTVHCFLCPHRCAIADGGFGICHVRQNRGGRLVSLVYGTATGFAADPVEKKPLAHFLPGTAILSFGTVGCNLRCVFCQNWTSSRAKADDIPLVDVTPDQVVALARKHGCPSIAYTYNEPIISAEFVVEVSRLARREGLKNVLVTNGYVTPEARPDVMECIDGANVDLKGFTERFYADLTGSHLEPVKDTLRWMVREAGVWVEITTLLIPGENDSPGEIAASTEWIATTLGADVPVHFTAFHPDYRLLSRPPTPPATLAQARAIAMQKGLRYVFVGNVMDEDSQSTYCPGCGKVVIRRNWHEIRSCELDGNRCRACGATIAGVFPGASAPAAPGRGPILP
ncbi:MAG: AmmeMemoRadiSam system radical SAM enzyme [Candidatus Riflebacteria bacterium]|nr:AmmeMemoRadiSam system radical SAM enzyme [Candidatus Riflebacteria bacterium]